MSDQAYPWLIGVLAVAGSLAGAALGAVAAMLYSDYLDQREAWHRDPVLWDGLGD